MSSIENEVPPVDKVFVRAKHNGSLALIWQHLWNDLPGPRIYEGVPSDGTRIRRIVQIQFPDEQQRYQIESTVGFVDVMEVTIFAELWIERKLAIVQSYDDEGHTLTRDAQFHVEHEGGKLVVSFSEDPEPGTQSIALWGAGKPDMATFLEADVSAPQSGAGERSCV